jgi:hypothetical protein
MTHRNQTVLANNTISGGTINHVGQIFFDQSLNDEVAKLPPYNTNTLFKTSNKNDMIMATGTAGNADNVVNYVLLGNKLEDGIFAWINFGIDTTNNFKVMVATECGEKGCATKPFDIVGIITTLLSGKSNGGLPGMPNIPSGGIPGYEAPSIADFFSGLGGSPGGGLADLIGSFFGGGKGKGPKKAKRDQVPAVL